MSTATMRTADRRAVDTHFGLQNYSVKERANIIIEALSDNQVQKVIDYAVTLADKDSPFKPISEEQMLADLARSDEHIREGRIKPASESVKSIREKYGLQ